MDYDVNWNHAQAAEAAGIRGIRVERPEDCQQAIKEALQINSQNQPALVEVMIPWDEPTPGFLEQHDVCAMEDVDFE